MRVGLVGAGRMGTFHAQTLASNSKVASITIFDADQARAEALASEIGGKAVHDITGFIRKADALVIASATDTHADLIRLGSEAGLPVFCEKPISLELETTDRVLDQVDRAGIPLHIGFQRRFDEGYSKARHLVASGGLGRLYAARLATHDPNPPHPSYLKASGGLFRDLMIHDFDIIRWTTGQEVDEVYAAGGVVTGSDEIKQLGDVDMAVVTLRLQSGAMAIISGLRHDPRGYDVRLELFGSKDSVVAGMSSRTPLRGLDDDRGATKSTEFQGFLDRFESAYREEINVFLQVASGEIDSPCSGIEARESLRIAFAAMASLRERRPVGLGEFK